MPGYGRVEAHGWPGRRERDADDELRRRSGGQAGERARDGGGACRRVERGEALSGGVSTRCHTGARAGAAGAAVCCMRGHAMPTGGGA
jgi:hypothetical protein